jgi:diaminohydroxyphosphoribosylaminopyrimidine deaminase/5-amino-6-(5-phosphoribosylamino)uracil reductase
MIFAVEMANQTQFTNADKAIMQRALALAARANGMTSPNPMVGAVLVKNGRVIAEGFHKKPGTPHAEVIAIERAGSKAKGSSLYVTLEPCCHVEKRTPPCVKAIINAEIKKVFIAMKDPNPKVFGQGINELQKHGVEVAKGLLEQKAKRLNEAYIKFITSGTPFVILKVAMTLDGKIAASDGYSKWITGEKARAIVHKMRSSVDAVMTGIGTVKADNPNLTVRHYKKREIKNPKRFVIDPGLESPLDYNIFNIPPETIVVASKTILEKVGSAFEEKKNALIKKGVHVLEYEGEKVDLGWLMKKFGEMGICSLMIEGGSSLGASSLNSGIVDKVVFFIAPKILGGRHSIPAIGGTYSRSLQESLKIDDIKITRVGQDIMIVGYVASAKK